MEFCDKIKQFNSKLLDEVKDIAVYKFFNI